MRISSFEPRARFAILAAAILAGAAYVPDTIAQTWHEPYNSDGTIRTWIPPSSDAYRPEPTPSARDDELNKLKDDVDSLKDRVDRAKDGFKMLTPKEDPIIGMPVGPTPPPPEQGAPNGVRIGVAPVRRPGDVSGLRKDVLRLPR